MKKAHHITIHTEQDEQWQTLLGLEAKDMRRLNALGMTLLLQKKKRKRRAVKIHTNSPTKVGQKSMCHSHQHCSSK